jgi:ABC-type polysaccharide/polyol phosphate export permease
MRECVFSGPAAADDRGLHQGVNVYWFWLLLVWPLEIAFVTGLALIFSALNVYIRDVRYVVESANVVCFG